MKEKHLIAYMTTAYAFAECSDAVRLKVGCLIVKDDRIISIGYNGMPSGWPNKCETEIYSMEKDEQPKLVTNPEVLHAETNAIAKLAKSTESGEGSIMFTTHAPCLDCAKLIHQSGIEAVIFSEDYRSEEGLIFLSNCGINVRQCKMEFVE